MTSSLARSRASSCMLVSSLSSHWLPVHFPFFWLTVVITTPLHILGPQSKSAWFPFERFQTPLTKIWKTPEEFRECSEEFRECSEGFDRRIFSLVTIFSLTGTPSPQLLTLVTKKMKTRTWPCQMLSVRVGKHFFTAVTLYTLTSVCIFFTLFSIHLLRCWKGDSL